MHLRNSVVGSASGLALLVGLSACHGAGAGATQENANGSGGASPMLNAEAASGGSPPDATPAPTSAAPPETPVSLPTESSVAGAGPTGSVAGGSGGNAAGAGGTLGGAGDMGGAGSGDTDEAGSGGGGAATVSQGVDAGSGGNAGSPGAPVAPGCTRFVAASAVAELGESTLEQLSGLVASRSQPGVFYAHVDAGAPPTVFVFDETGEPLGTLLLSGVQTTDWEDLAASTTTAEGPAWLYIGDIGDNAARQGGTPRAELEIYRFPEPPAPEAGEELLISDWERVPVVYPETAFDAETLLFDPLNQELLLVTKTNDGLSSFFRLPADTAADEVFPLEWVADVQSGPAGSQAAQVSAGDISPQGDRILLRTYENALLWSRGEGQSLAEALAVDPFVLATADEPQSEGITFAADGASWYSAGEQSLTLYRAEASCP